MLNTILARISEIPRENLYLAAAILLILGQLVGVGALAQAQVNKAQQREAAWQTQHTAVVQCLESSNALQLEGCLSDAKRGRSTMVVSLNGVGRGINASLMPAVFAYR